VCDDGLVIDLSPMNYVRVDPKKRTVLAGGGALWGAVDHATHALGLAVPSGIISTTGVAGHRIAIHWCSRVKRSV
jgi:FAD/FMN-containing dehydrogenase